MAPSFHRPVNASGVVGPKDPASAVAGAGSFGLSARYRQMPEATAPASVALVVYIDVSTRSGYTGATLLV